MLLLRDSFIHYRREEDGIMQDIIAEKDFSIAPVSRLSNYSHEENRTATLDEVLNVSRRLIARHREAYLELAK